MSGNAENRKPRVVFVDDEQRVLNSMRVRFRREYDLHLTTLGSEALAILQEHDIDVIVADQRMPEMQGTEVLAAAKGCSPRTVRILLTGYADLDAIEASINDGEVFRFLTKPCAPDELRDTIQQAVEIARDQDLMSVLEAEEKPAISLDILEEDTAPESSPVPEPSTIAEQAPATANEASPVSEAPAPIAAAAMTAVEPESASLHEEMRIAAAETPDDAIAEMSLEPADDARANAAPERIFAPPAASGEFHPEPVDLASLASDDDPDAITIVLEGDSASIFSEGTSDTASIPAAIAAGVEDKIGVLVFTEDDTTMAEIREMLGDRYMVVGAGNIVSVTKLLKATRPGVLVTDISEDLEVIETMVNALKSHLPELVTIVVGEHRDTVGLVNLINYGQIYRFLQKPLAAGTFSMTVKAATQKHLQLKKYPELARRYAVRNKDTDENVRGGALRGFLERLRSMSRLWATHS